MRSYDSLSLLVSCLMLINGGLTFNYDLKYLEDYCNRTHLTVWDGHYNSTIVLKGRKRGGRAGLPSTTWSSSCNVTIIAPANGGLILTVDEIDLYNNYHPYLDTLKVIVDDNTSRIWSDGAINIDEQESLTTAHGDNTIELLLSSSPEASNHRSNFKFILTSYIHANGMPCPPDYFHCGNNRCIRQELTCDKHNNCGNGLDETQCFDIGIVGILLFALLIIVLMLCTAMCQLVCNRKKHVCHVNPFPNGMERPCQRDFYRTRTRCSYGSGDTKTKRMEKAPAYEPPPPYPGV